MRMTLHPTHVIVGRCSAKADESLGIFTPISSKGLRDGHTRREKRFVCLHMPYHLRPGLRLMSINPRIQWASICDEVTLSLCLESTENRFRHEIPELLLLSTKNPTLEGRVHEGENRSPKQRNIRARVEPVRVHFKDQPN